MFNTLSVFVSLIKLIRNIQRSSVHQICKHASTTQTQIDGNLITMQKMVDGIKQWFLSAKPHKLQSQRWWCNEQDHELLRIWLLCACQLNFRPQHLCRHVKTKKKQCYKKDFPYIWPQYLPKNKNKKKMDFVQWKHDSK